MTPLGTLLILLWTVVPAALWSLLPVLVWRVPPRPWMRFNPRRRAAILAEVVSQVRAGEMEPHVGLSLWQRRVGAVSCRLTMKEAFEPIYAAGREHIMDEISAHVQRAQIDTDGTAPHLTGRRTVP